MKALPPDLTVDDPRNWDFSACPTEELWPCYMYEFFREYPHARERVAGWRKKHPGKRFDDWLPTIQNPLDDDRPYACGYDLFVFCPEWPGKPYLSILPAERQRRLKLMPKLLEERERQCAVQVVHLPTVFHWYAESPLPGWKAHLPPMDRATVKEDDFHETICVTVDWRHHPRTIAKMFEELLVQIRPGKTGLWKTKGKGRFQEQLRVRLKALGAWRLLNKYKLLWAEAEELTAKINASGNPLFDGQSHWLRARKQAVYFLNHPLTFGLAG